MREIFADLAFIFYPNFSAINFADYPICTIFSMPRRPTISIC